MTLHVESHGSGKPLVMLHGWGMHGGIWGAVVPQLAQNFRVHCVDLPGHGYSARIEDASDAVSPITHHASRITLDAIVEQLSAQFDAPLHVCGWSLGGQLALRWACLHPAQVEKLILVASTPCFVQRADWQCAMQAEVFQEFSRAMAQQYQATLKRFLALQVRGSDNERELLLSLRERLFSRGEPDGEALRGGLEILRDTDLRMQLGQIGQETLVIAGVRDTLAPLAASEFMVQALPHARLKSVAGAAHAPFLSHPEIFSGQIVDFMHE